jgi:hypothetical protein
MRALIARFKYTTYKIVYFINFEQNRDDLEDEVLCNYAFRLRIVSIHFKYLLIYTLNILYTTNLYWYYF